MVRVRKASSLIFSTKSSVREDFRKALFQQPKTDNDFADRFIREAPSLLPASFLESFVSIRSRLVEINSIPNIVYTANSHWYDDQFKIWAAEMRIFGARMVFSEHGGSFEGAELLFDFEQRISDHYISGWPPRRPNETQLPLRLVSSKTKKRGSYEKGNLLLVTYPGVKWSIRASSQPQSYRAMSIADDLERLVDRLKAIPASKITVQLAQSDLSWGLLESHYSSGSLSDCETAKSPLSVMLRKARLVVCTYPQTTFMDSLMAGVPTILLFTQDVSGLSDNSQEVLTKLSEQGVVFYSAEQAANFIDSIWGNPMEWWKASDTRRAIDEFLRFTMLDKEKPLDCLSGFLQQAVLQKKSS